MKKITKAAIAGTAGVALLLGGAGTLAYWNDTQTGGAVTIAAGDLKFGTITDGTGWTLQQKAADLPAGQAETGAGTAYTNQLIVPGDVLSKTVSVPVTITGANNKATFTVSSVAPTTPNALSSALVTAVQVNGASAQSVTLTPADTTVSVTYTVTLPWGTAGSSNAVKTLSTPFQAKYDLVQIPKTPAVP